MTVRNKTDMVIYNNGELAPVSVVANFAPTASDGKSYNVEYYNILERLKQ